MASEQAVEFATRTVFGDPVTTEEKDEVVETLRELVAYFGGPAIMRAITDCGISGQTPSVGGNEQILQALRVYSCLIIDSDRPMLTVKLVGKLAKMELATGKRISFADLGRSEGISKQAVSKRMAHYADRLNLDRPDSTAEARDSYRAANRRNYSTV